MYFHRQGSDLCTRNVGPELIETNQPPSYTKHCHNAKFVNDPMKNCSTDAAPNCQSLDFWLFLLFFSFFLWILYKSPNFLMD